MRLPALAAVLACGCATAPDTPAAAKLSPASIQAAIRSLITAYPDAKAFSALDYNGRGVTFATDGTATFVDPLLNRKVETTTSGFKGNTICIAQAGDFPGLCIDLYRTDDGSYFCDETSGDGQRAQYDCTIMPAREV